jgi:hypothetical protein
LGRFPLPELRDHYRKRFSSLKLTSRGDLSLALKIERVLMHRTTRAKAIPSGEPNQVIIRGVANSHRDSPPIHRSGATLVSFAAQPGLTLQAAP